MRPYVAPAKDMNFVLNEVLEIEKVYAEIPKFADKVNIDIFNQYLDVASAFCQNELLPLSAKGDEVGCTLQDGKVKTPPGFKAAYDKYRELGFPSLTGDEKYGGYGYPTIFRIAISEVITSTNWAWGMYPGLSHGAMRTIEHHGSKEQKDKFLPYLIEGKWTGTMCLTESHAGSDLGQIRTKAIKNEDGSYNITGEKIFISAGEHDLSENIIHIVLARLPDAPVGTKGISLFIVPKFNVDDQGNIENRNKVYCSSLEHKMGIHGNATCVLNFDGAKGYLIGPENRGLNCMFTFMNAARIGTAIQGLAACESSYQGALAYSKDRLAMRALSGAINPEKPADPIFYHPAVKSMLLTQKVFAEGSRMLAYYLATYADLAEHVDDENLKKTANDKLALLTPIAKALLTELGVESAKHGMQVFGGHGYISEHGMEQIARDARISTLYEGTTEIQALDLLARKVVGSNGVLLNTLIDEIKDYLNSNTADEELSKYSKKLNSLIDKWSDISTKVLNESKNNLQEVGAASVDYLYLSGYIVLGYLWLKMGFVAQNKIDDGSSDKFYYAKLESMKFYFNKILTRTSTHIENIENSNDQLFSIDENSMKFD